MNAPHVLAAMPEASALSAGCVGAALRINIASIAIIGIDRTTIDAAQSMP
jgi:hypothetical protein